MIVAITGGIGSGKSVVSKILRLLGYSVYDTDYKAKILMRESVSLRSLLIERFGADIYKEKQLNTKLLSSIVFSDRKALSDLNAIVHPAVKNDMLRWAKQCGGIVFVETAIPYSSGIYLMVDKIWKVSAPTAVRVERVMARNGMTREQVMERMASQSSEEVANEKDVLICNDNTNALIPQIIENLKLLK